MYLMSDFPVAPSKYKRLSKLIVYCVLSRESKMLAESLINKRVRSLVTTAFTNNPASMKYRGLLKQLTRQDVDQEESKGRYLYKVNYGAPMGRWTLKEGLAQWKKKHSQTGGNTEE